MMPCISPMANGPCRDRRVLHAVNARSVCLPVFRYLETTLDASNRMTKMQRVTRFAQYERDDSELWMGNAWRFAGYRVRKETIV